MADLDPAGVICPVCSTDAEFDAYYVSLHEADALIAQTMRDEAVDEALGRPPAGRPSDAMMGIPPPDETDD